MKFINVQVGYPIVDTSDIIPEEEYNLTLVTTERYLPRIMVEAGIVKSTSEVRRNRPDLCIEFEPDKTDCIEIKWGKSKLFLLIGLAQPWDKFSLLKEDSKIAMMSLDGIHWHMNDNAKFIIKTIDGYHEVYDVRNPKYGIKSTLVVDTQNPRIGSEMIRHIYYTYQ